MFHVNFINFYFLFFFLIRIMLNLKQIRIRLSMYMAYGIFMSTYLILLTQFTYF